VRSLDVVQAIVNRPIPLGQLADVLRPLLGISLQPGIIVLNTCQNLASSTLSKAMASSASIVVWTRQDPAGKGPWAPIAW